jgi:hypothetical protein
LGIERETEFKERAADLNMADCRVKESKKEKKEKNSII